VARRRASATCNSRDGRDRRCESGSTGPGGAHTISPPSDVSAAAARPKIFTSRPGIFEPAPTPSDEAIRSSRSVADVHGTSSSPTSIRKSDNRGSVTRVPNPRGRVAIGAPDYGRTSFQDRSNATVGLSHLLPRPAPTRSLSIVKCCGPCRSLEEGLSPGVSTQSFIYDPTTLSRSRSTRVS